MHEIKPSRIYKAQSIYIRLDRYMIILKLFAFRQVIFRYYQIFIFFCLVCLLKMSLTKHYQYLYRHYHYRFAFPHLDLNKLWKCEILKYKYNWNWHRINRISQGFISCIIFLWKWNVINQELKIHCISAFSTKVQRMSTLCNVVACLYLTRTLTYCYAAVTCNTIDQGIKQIISIHAWFWHCIKSHYPPCDHHASHF